LHGSDLVFGKYEIIRRIAAGGMGEIFLARQIGVAGFDRRVILKSLLPSLAADQHFVDRFLDEARVAAKLNHPNIVSILEIGQHRGTYFIAMEYVEGEDLGSLLRFARGSRRAIPAPIAAHVGLEVARALDHAHHATDERGPLGIVHRDISPGNIMVRTDGLTKVLDFGVVFAVIRRAQTAIGGHPGKLRYMSPEQIGGGKLDGRSDQFSLGVVIWELLVQDHLFPGNDYDALLRNRLAHEVKRPSARGAAIDPALEEVIMQMLARAPEDRFASSHQVAAALESWLRWQRGGDASSAGALVRSMAGERIRARGSADSEDVSETNLLSEDLAATTEGATIPLVVKRAEASRSIKRTGIWSIALGVVAALFAIGIVERTPEGEPWVEVFHDDFDRRELGPGWEVLRGKVAIHDGELCSRFGHAVSIHGVGDSVRLEYEARIMPDSDDARELSAFVSGSRAGGLVDGYSFEFGILQDIEEPGYRHGLLRARKAISFTPSDPIERDRRYRIAVERRSDQLEMFDGGDTVLRFVDPVPLVGTDHEYFGFGSKAAHLHYDRVRIRIPLRNARAFAVRALDLGIWNDAEIALAAVAEHESDPESRAWLQVQRARALVRQGKLDEAEPLLQAPAAAGGWRRSARAIRAEVLARRGDPEAAWTALVTTDGTRSLSSPDAVVVKEALLEIFRTLENESPAKVRTIVEHALARTANPDPSVLEATVTLLFDRDAAPDLLSLPKSTWRHVVQSYPYAAAKPVLDEIRRQLAGEPRILVGILATLAVRALNEGQAADARALVEEASRVEKNNPVEPSQLLAHVWAFLGDERRALEHRSRFSEDSAVSAARVAYILLALERNDEAFAAFEAIADRWGDASVDAVQAQYLTGRCGEEQMDRFDESDAIDRHLLRALRDWRTNDFVSARVHLDRVPRDGSPARAFDHLLARRLIGRLSGRQH
jgi:tetratricopeptide (TPR) repeat protein